MQHVKKPPRRVEFEKTGPKRHQQDIRCRQCIDREIPKRGRRIEHDDIVFLQRAVRGQPIPQRIPKLPASPRHAPDRDLELRPVEIQLRANEVDVGPVGRLRQIARRELQSLAERLVEGLGRLPPTLPCPVLLALIFAVVTRQKREGRLPFILDTAPEDRRHRSLAVEIDHQHPVAIKCRRHRQMRRSRGFTNATFEIGHGHNLGGQTFGAVGQVVLRLRALCRKMGPQLQDIIKCEPLCPALGFCGALGQVGVLTQHTAEMGRRYGDQVACDLPR